MIDKAEQDGKITEAQADKLRQAAQDLADGKRPDIRGLGRDADVHEVIHDAFAAAADKAPGIAEPIIDKAVSDKKITEAQADRIREMVKRGGPAPGPARGPARLGGPRPAPSARFADADVRAVLEDIHAAVAKQAPDIVKPRDRQGRAGRQDHRGAGRPAARHAGNLIGGKPHGDRRGCSTCATPTCARCCTTPSRRSPRSTPDIAKPIIDKALADKKITEAQADQLRTMRPRQGPGTATARGRFGPGRRTRAPGRPGSAGPAAPKPPQGSIELGALRPTDVRRARPLLRGRAARTDSECMKKLSLVVALLFALAFPPSRPRRAAPATRPLRSTARRCAPRSAPTPSAPPSRQEAASAR